MSTVYEKKTGKPLNCQTVDARELIASGAYVAEDPNAEKPKQKTIKQMTVDELKVALDAAKVTYKDDDKKDDLIKLLEDATKTE